MRANEFHRNAVVDLRSEAGRALVKCGAWLTSAYIGASLLGIGLLRLSQKEGSALTSLALVFAGGAWAAIAWLNARRAVARIDEPPVAAKAHAPAQLRALAERSTSGLTTLIGAPEA